MFVLQFGFAFCLAVQHLSVSCPLYYYLRFSSLTKLILGNNILIYNSWICMYNLYVAVTSFHGKVIVSLSNFIVAWLSCVMFHLPLIFAEHYL